MLMDYNFDQVINRRSSDCEKWTCFDEDIIPLCEADMDFASPDCVIQALHERLEHKIFGYPKDQSELRGVVSEHLKRRYKWDVPEEAIILIPGVVPAFSLAIKAFTQPGNGVLVQTPVYDPILLAPGYSGCTRDAAPLVRKEDGSYQVDLDVFQAAITGQTRLFLMCNPHNPTGRVFRQDELLAMAECCLHHDLVICSDEIHCDLVYSGSRHTPIASLDSEIGNRTITLMAPSKTYNIAGLHNSFAVIQNPEMRQRFCGMKRFTISSFLNVFAHTAMLAGYRQGQPWLDALLLYLESNRDHLYEFIKQAMPGLNLVKPEGTFLAWINCNELELPCSPRNFFHEQARVSLREGETYGPGGEGYVRLNFACPRSILDTALERMKNALSSLG